MNDFIGSRCMCGKSTEANPGAIEEARSFLDTYFKQVFSRGRGEEGSAKLSSISAAAKVASFHNNEELNKDDFAKFFTSSAEKSFGSYLRTATREKVNAELVKNKEESDEATRNGIEFKWNDPVEPKPRNYVELADVSGAFADPIPNFKLVGGKRKAIKGMSLNIDPEQRLSPEVLEALKQTIEGSKEAYSPDTVEKHLERVIYNNLRIGGGSYVNPVAVIKSSFEKRKEQILEHHPEYKKDIIRFNINKPETAEPFIHLGLYAEDEEAVKEFIPGNRIASRNDATEFLKTLVGKDITQSDFNVISRYLIKIYPNPDAEVFKSNSEFANLFETDFSSLLENASNVKGITKKIDPKYETETPKQIEVNDDLRKDIVKALELIDALLNSVVPSDKTMLEEQINRGSELMGQTGKILSRYNKVKDNDPALRSAAENLKALSGKLSNRNNQSALRLKGFERIEEEKSRGALKSIVDNIIKLLSVPGIWNRQAVQDMTIEVYSLLQGNEEEVVHPSMVGEASKILNALVETIKNVNNMTPADRKKSLPPDFSSRMLKQLKNHLSQTRAGASYFIEEDE